MLAVDAARHTVIAVDADSYYILAVEEASFIVCFFIELFWILLNIHI